MVRFRPFQVAAGRPFAPELVELEQSWSDWERGLTKGAKPEDDDIYVVIDKAKKGDEPGRAPAHDLVCVWPGRPDVVQRTHGVEGNGAADSATGLGRSLGA